MPVRSRRHHPRRVGAIGGILLHGSLDVDVSPEMFAPGRRICGRSSRTRLTLYEGDTGSLEIPAPVNPVLSSLSCSVTPRHPAGPESGGTTYRPGGGLVVPEGRRFVGRETRSPVWGRSCHAHRQARVLTCFFSTASEGREGHRNSQGKEHPRVATDPAHRDFRISQKVASAGRELELVPNPAPSTGLQSKLAPA